MTYINRASFIPTEKVNSYDPDGTVEVTLHGKTRRVPASIWADRGQITAYRIATKYRTGTKVWSGRITQWPNGNESVSGGFDNRSTASRIASIVGFMDEIDEKHHSQR
jgi:hypothetical protein